MTVTDAIHAYNVGSLIGFNNRELNELNILLTQKVTFMYQVARQESVSPEVLADLRKYQLVHSEVVRLIEKRTSVPGSSMTII